MIPPDPTPRAPRDQRHALFTHVFPALTYVVGIFYTGLIRLGKLPEVTFVPTDKLLHALAFGGLALLLVRALRAIWPHMSQGRRFWAAALVASLLGALLEVCQAYVPYRSAEFLDWFADTVGAGCAVGLLALFLRLAPRRVHG